VELCATHQWHTEQCRNNGVITVLRPTARSYNACIPANPADPAQRQEAFGLFSQWMQAKKRTARR
jgi:hypothetical protein